MTSGMRNVPDWLVVSRETAERLGAYCDLVVKWNPAINLVGKAGLTTLWQRHIINSAQIFRLTSPAAARWCDLGSGGGFPGLVVAILAKEDRPLMRTTLVEADQRKAVFLSEVIRTLDLNAHVVAKRIEAVEPLRADVVSARALAPLALLCGYALRHLKPGGLAIFPKGSTVDAEIEDARSKWIFDFAKIESQTDPGAAIIAMRGIENV